MASKKSSHLAACPTCKTSAARIKGLTKERGENQRGMNRSADLIVKLKARLKAAWSSRNGKAWRE